ncbi:MAG TPA: hypothetical protein PKY59_18725 [Pyrinomonadaceae bacterium]|nr:hypothetical protein [Pyrinomonadaceae bacterium]
MFTAVSYLKVWIAKRNAVRRKALNVGQAGMPALQLMLRVFTEKINALRAGEVVILVK